MSLKIGDKVQCVKDFEGGGWNGLTGTVVAFSDGSPGVDFKRQSSIGKGHYLSGNIKAPTGWWFHGDEEEHYLKKVVKQFEFSFW